jgi:polyphosphate glucokinase
LRQARFNHKPARAPSLDHHGKGDYMKKATDALPEKAAPKSRKSAASPIHTLAIDIGGTRTKASVLDEQGQMTSERVRTNTPDPCPPDVLLATIDQLVKQLPDYQRISVGFPGVVRKGRIYSAHNLGQELWYGFNLGEALEKQLKRPVRVANDADMQGLGAIRGDGVELVITLGTGFGSALFEDGKIAPHLELAHHPFRNGESYEEQLGIRALEAVGKKRWNRRLQRAIKTLRALASFDRLFIGGGNAEHIKFELPADIEIVPNTLGMIGGIWLWRERGGTQSA